MISLKIKIKCIYFSFDWEAKEIFEPLFYLYQRWNENKSAFRYEYF